MHAARWRKYIAAVALAGLKRIFVVPHLQRQRRRRRRKKKKKKKRRVKEKLMNIWQNVIFPVKRLCLALSIRLNLNLNHHHRNNNGAGLVKLRDDVQTCEYEDVQVMWEMLQKTTDQTQVIDDKDNHHHKRKQLPFWRVYNPHNQSPPTHNK